MTRPLHFTKRALENLPPAPEGRRDYYPMVAIDRDAVERRHRHISERSPAGANYSMKLVRADRADRLATVTSSTRGAGCTR